MHVCHFHTGGHTAWEQLRKSECRLSKVKVEINGAGYDTFAQGIGLTHAKPMA